MPLADEHEGRRGSSVTLLAMCMEDGGNASLSNCLSLPFACFDIIR